MIRLKWLVIIALFCAADAYSESKWIRMQSPNFEAYSSAGERETRDALRYFERVRDFFLQVNQREPPRPVPMHVVVFGSEKEYAPYRLNEFATAYYFGGAGRDYIVMGRTGEQAAQIAVHEYVHLVARHAGLKFPPWLNEGTAELYSTIRMQGDKVLVGDLIPVRIQALKSDAWVPLAAILSAGPDSPYYNERDKAGSLYNEGWALVHMLQLSPAYVSKYSEFVRTVQSGVDSAAALEKVYGKTVSAIEKDLQEYTRSFQFYGRLFPVKLASVKESFPATPAPMFDVKLALTDLTNRPGKETETRKTLEDLAREDPKRPEPWASLGYLEWRGNRFSEAVDAFGKAYGLGSRGPEFLWDYGRLAERDHPDAAVTALTDLFKLEPDRLDVRMELAALQLNARRPGGALSVLADVRSVTPEDAPRFFSLLANAQLQLRDLDGARVTVAKLAANAKTPEDRTRVEQMQRYLEQSNTPAPPIAINAPEGPPRLTRPAAPTQSSALPPPTPEIEGSFVEFICLEKGFKVIVDTSKGKKGFLIPDPNQVVIVGRAGGKVDLNCGPQTPAHVKVEYEPSTTASDADGILKVLFFEP
ncbi:MAG: tetratricopeptide repeat protein [Acidobacteriia bacterium]|nr:tetratricopeptide repeat protein [Terriglobia bacterium]